MFKAGQHRTLSRQWPARGGLGHVCARSKGARSMRCNSQARAAAPPQPARQLWGGCSRLVNAHAKSGERLCTDTSMECAHDPALPGGGGAGGGRARTA